jgi:hypothetical protein
MMSHFLRVACAVVITITTSAGYAQLQQTDWLNLRFGEQEAALIVSAGGEKLSYYQALNRQGFAVSDVHMKAVSELPDALLVDPLHPQVAPLSEAQLLEGDFDAELYDFQRKQSEHSVYRIGSTGFVLTIWSFDYVRDNLTLGQ